LLNAQSLLLLFFFSFVSIKAKFEHLKLYTCSKRLKQKLFFPIIYFYNQKNNIFRKMGADVAERKGGEQAG